MSALKRYWWLISGFIAPVAYGLHLHLLADAARDVRLDQLQEQIRVLKTVAVQEHPAYWPMLFPGVKP